MTILSQSERERQIPCAITYAENLKYDTNELTYEQKQNYGHTEQTGGYQGAGG